jgi:hypothetical protein
MLFLRGKKGAGKKVEFLLAIVVLVAVVVVVLEVFSGGLSGKADKLKMIEQSVASKRYFYEARQACYEQCRSALDSDCGEMMQAQFCIAAIKGGLDLDGDGSVTNEYDQELLEGVGLCEDSLYCSQLVECSCEQRLDMHGCVALLCEIWAAHGVPDPASALRMYLSPGSCYRTNEPMHWYNLERGTNTELLCPVK